MDTALNNSTRMRTKQTSNSSNQPPPERDGYTLRIVATVLGLLLVCGAATWMTRPSGRSSASGIGRGESTPVDQELAGIDRLITELQTANQAVPTSSSTDLLGTLLLRRARLSGDAQTLSQAEMVAAQAVALAPSNASARMLLARVQYSSHRFAEAAATARRVLKSEATNTEALGVLADASAEIGDLSSAATALSALASGEPSAPVKVRLARRAFVGGDVVTATQLADEAIVSASDSGLRASDRAFYSSFAGQIAFDRGDHAASRSLFQAALAISPGDRSAAFGLARAEAALGNVDRAIARLEANTDQYPDPIAFSLLGDLYSIAGEPDQAQLAYDLVLATAALAVANQQIYDRQLAMFFADHALQPQRALAMALSELDSGRHDVYAYDTFAWTSYRAGNLDDADRASHKAIAEGTRDASVLAHAGLISLAKGRTAEASDLLAAALKINPSFHPIVAQEAKSALQQITAKG